MLTYSLATPPHSPADIRLFFKKPRSSSARRALVELGVNNSKENIRMAQAICSLAQDEFRKRWDFDPESGRPLDSERYQWTAVKPKKSQKSPKTSRDSWGLSYLGYIDDCKIPQNPQEERDCGDLEPHGGIFNGQQAPVPPCCNPAGNSNLCCNPAVNSNLDLRCNPAGNSNLDLHCNQEHDLNLRTSSSDSNKRDSSQPRMLHLAGFLKSPCSRDENVRWIDGCSKSQSPKTPSRKNRSLDSHTPRTKQCKITDFGRQRKRLHSFSKVEEGESEREVCGPRKRLVLSPIKTHS